MTPSDEETKAVCNMSPPSSEPSTNSNCGRDDESTRDEVREVQRTTEAETRTIQIWRIIVGSIIMVAGGLVSWGTFFYLENQLEDETIDKFNLFVNSIEDISLMHFKSMKEACGSLSRAMTAQAVAEKARFPFFTMKNWEVHANDARQQGVVEAFVFFPWLIGPEEVEEFNSYAVDNSDWQLESIEVHKTFNPELANRSFKESPNTYVFDFPSFQATSGTGRDPVMPFWTLSPPAPSSNSMMLTNMYPLYKELFQDAISSRDFGLGEMDLEVGEIIGTAFGKEYHDSYHTNLHNTSTIGNLSSSTQAHGYVVQPVFYHLSAEAKNYSNENDKIRGGIGGFLLGFFGFDAELVNILPDGIRGIRVLIQNDCNQIFTYELDGNKATFMGSGDLTDSDFSHLKREINFDKVVYPRGNESLTGNRGYCRYKFLVTPTSLYMEDNQSNLPLIFTIVVATIFAVMVIAFFIYDMKVDKRNRKIVTTAARSNAIVSSIFPSTIRDRLLAIQENGGRKPSLVHGGLLLQPTKTHLKSFLTSSLQSHAKAGENDDDIVFASKPIADLFNDTTVMFADISGFTAWSSVREPSQVFTLLETVYRAFDIIAKKRGVFKVETVGDCYVAVCGLPDPRLDHAVVMAKFARDCMARMEILSKKLEVMLGPDTGDLGIRIGLHSGPVTAGVLRGERSRFQLFGDTMNTASRMESTGERNRIQISAETAKLLEISGKEHWLIPRDQLVQAKGKGIMSTYWLKRNEMQPNETISNEENYVLPEEPNLPVGTASTSAESKTARLIEWNVEVLFSILKQIVTLRKELKTTASNDIRKCELNLLKEQNSRSTTKILDEVEEVIWLPRHSDSSAKEPLKAEEDDISPAVANELLVYVSNIAQMYNNHPFHNFEHASHVTMSVVKLLSRIVAPSEVDYDILKSGNGGHQPQSSSLHDHTYGITSDPLTQFSCVLSALIHDADHPGVPNAQLVKEGLPLAVRYGGKSVAEQNSVQLAWDLLMEDRFRNLRAVIYSTEAELKRFRQLVVNSVMATDIVDKELKALRNARWEKAFPEMEMPQPSSSELENVNRKATVVIEHLIQASDVAHTMQHWHIYRKWNERFFMECFQAYEDGRAEKNPVDFWYKGEIGFFDFYIVPLAKKLKECGVFGVSSDEYLNYALQNRSEWEMRGQEIVEEMVNQIKTRPGCVIPVASKKAVQFSDLDNESSSRAVAEHRQGSSSEPNKEPIEEEKEGNLVWADEEKASENEEQLSIPTGDATRLAI